MKMVGISNGNNTSLIDNVHKGRLPRSYFGAAKYSLVMTYFYSYSITVLQSLHALQHYRGVMPVIVVMCNGVFVFSLLKNLIFHRKIVSLLEYLCFDVGE